MSGKIKIGSMLPVLEYQARSRIYRGVEDIREREALTLSIHTTDRGDFWAHI